MGVLERHTNASYNLAMTAIESRITRATDTFHGMSVIHRRRLGVLEATLSNDKIHAELISDGYHGELIWGKTLHDIKITLKEGLRNVVS